MRKIGVRKVHSSVKHLQYLMGLNIIFLICVIHYTLREENEFGRKECGIKDCELDL